MKLEKEGNSFYVNNKKDFKGSSLEYINLDKAFNFAYEMTFGKGHHRESRSGGKEVRTLIKIFRNTLQGKIAEISLYNYFLENEINCGNVDFSVYGKGIWDDADLIYKSKKISIKSTASFSNLLLLETKDWNSNGQYIPNINNLKLTDSYDYYVLVRISPSTNSLFKTTTNKDNLKKEFNAINWSYDIPGCCSSKTIKHIIKEEYILPKDALLNDKIKMDAENYYIQSNSLLEIKVLIDNLKNYN